ncbi:glycosyltransferase family 2 protein [uncultured Parolsenella sp.]|uniref:glycosyltransferase family 2 protein n=1 Tax=uncultured Parolsenella sp. TaxID=2083008 RepID=UPI0025E5EF01|nr:glycosyltransferase family 2 protein [uncultured Parolsenella sp.]
MRKPPIVCIVIPCYNEQEVLPVTSALFAAELDELVGSGRADPASHVLLVNDGSRDRTWEIIEGLSEQDPRFRGMSLSRNRGHQNALLAGLMECRSSCDCAISIDCDGQDDISAMGEMVDAYLDGCDVVYGVRSSRETDTAFKRATAQGFYRLLGAMGVECVYNHADYRLMAADALEALSQFQEVNLFLRGMVPLVGFKSTSVYYERHERMAGKSHYPLSKMVALAVDGITSLSVRPIRLIAWTGLVVALASLVAIVWVLVRHAMGATVTGWASTTAAVCFMGGVQMLSLGVIGEYVGKVYMETKRRPRWIISKRTWESRDDD